MMEYRRNIGEIQEKYSVQEIGSTDTRVTSQLDDWLMIGC